jgi:serine/threonine protein kinase
VDWWALGVLVFEMLLGMAPFYGNTEDEIFEQILYSRISLKGQRITPEARNIIAAVCCRLLRSHLLSRLGGGGGEGASGPLPCPCSFPGDKNVGLVATDQKYVGGAGIKKEQSQGVTLL